MSIFSQAAVGIDIGHASVRVAGLKLGKKPVVLGCKELPLDPKFIDKEGISDPLAVGQVVKNALQASAPHPLTVRTAYLCINEESVFRKVLDLPWLENPEELAQAARLEVAQYLPESPESMEIDYQPLGVSPDGKSQQIMVAALPQKLIQDYQAVAEAAKLSLKVIDLAASALGRAAVGKDEKGVFLLADIGGDSSSISLYENNLVRVTGTINLGGDVIRDPDTGEIEEDERDAHLKQLALALADEIDHVRKFYSNRSEGQGKVKELRLTGGGSMIPGLTDFIGKETGLSTLSAKPTIAVPPFCDRRFMAALGAALYPTFEAL